jgi:DNA-binding GntR family transcriptional regulator
MTVEPPHRLTTIEPLERRSSVEQRVARTLRELIVTGRLPEGTPLVQRELAERLGVSPTPVRAGLTRLEHDGLVLIGETGRAAVSRLTREDLEEVYAARFGLEGLAARLGARSLSAADLARMQPLLAEIQKLAKREAIDDYLEARWEFHAVCYRASGRKRLLAEVERLFWRSERYNRLLLSTPERFRQSVSHYRAFLDACRAVDGERAERVIQASVRWCVDQLWQSLPSEQDSD